MRLLSFLNLVELTLGMLRPEASSGWRRRANHSAGEALSWHPALGLALHLRVSEVAEGRHSVLARWIGPAGAVLLERTYFCGESSFEWQTAAESVAETMPEGGLLEGAASPDEAVPEAVFASSRA